LDYRLTEAAEADITDILRETTRRFGRSQRGRYAGYLQRAIELIAEKPDRPGSRRRSELGAGIRSFHIELAAQRLGAASHLLYYFRAVFDDDQEGVVILRVLHEAMDPERHLSRQRTQPSSR
jgi:toxin ParE1/3/4